MILIDGKEVPGRDFSKKSAEPNFLDGCTPIQIDHLDKQLEKGTRVTFQGVDGCSERILVWHEQLVHYDCLWFRTMP